MAEVLSLCLAFALGWQAWLAEQIIARHEKGGQPPK